MDASNLHGTFEGQRSSRMGWLIHIIRYGLVHWGYLAVLVALFAESAGVPVPGETTLILASFMAHKSASLNLGWVIAAGIGGAVLGDNCGFWVGRWLGPRLLIWLDRKFGMKDDIETAQEMITNHGGKTVFWARYLFGLRTVAGPAAGALKMDWKRFLVFNALGGATWVMVIAWSGYGFSHQVKTLFGFVEKVLWALSLGIMGVGYLLWRHKKKNMKKRKHAAAGGGS